MTTHTNSGLNVTSLLTTVATTGGQQQRGVLAMPRAAEVGYLALSIPYAKGHVFNLISDL